MAYSYTTVVREDDGLRHTYAEVKYGKIVAINEHWVSLDEYVKFFEPDALFIDITDVEVNGDKPQVGDTVTSNGIIVHNVDNYSPAVLREYTIEMMKLTRDKKELEPIAHTVNGVEYLFDADEDANTRMAKARQLLEDSGMESIVWTTYDNDHVTLTVNDFKAINIAQAVRSSELHSRYNELKLYINSLDDEKTEILREDFSWDSNIAEEV